jgi:hypothetical protein
MKMKTVELKTEQRPPESRDPSEEQARTTDSEYWLGSFLHFHVFASSLSSFNLPMGYGWPAYRIASFLLE